MNDNRLLPAPLASAAFFPPLSKTGPSPYDEEPRHMMPESHAIHRGPSYQTPYMASSVQGDPASSGAYGGYGGMPPGAYGSSMRHLPAVGAGGGVANEAHNVAVSAGWRTASLPDDG